MFCNKVKRNCKFYKYCNGYDYDNLGLNKKKINRFLFSQDQIHNLLYLVGLKSVIKIENINVKNIDNYPKNLPDGYKKAYYSVIEEKTFNKDFLNNENVNILISNDLSNLRKFIYYDNSSNFLDRVVGTGKLLGYPNCCIKNAVTNSIGIDRIKKFEKWEAEVFKKGVFCPLISNKNKLYVHYPCSNSCISTIENSEKLLDFLCKKYGKSILDQYFYHNYFKNSIDEM